MPKITAHAAAADSHPQPDNLTNLMLKTPALTRFKLPLWQPTAASEEPPLRQVYGCANCCRPMGRSHDLVPRGADVACMAAAATVTS